MTPQNAQSYHTAEEEWLVAYSAGGLSQSKRLLLTCQAAINPKFAQKLSDMDLVGGALLESAAGDALSADFMSGVFSKINDGDPAEPKGQENLKLPVPSSETWAPRTLHEFINGVGKSLSWSKIGFGMERMSILKEGREKLYLLKTPAGMKMPRHSHRGEEWALILQGGYHTGNVGFVRGDLHREDETCTHQPIVDDHGEPCITLVASEGGLKFSNPIMWLMTPFLGI